MVIIVAEVRTNEPDRSMNESSICNDVHVEVDMLYYMAANVLQEVGSGKKSM